MTARALLAVAVCCTVSCRGAASGPAVVASPPPSVAPVPEVALHLPDDAYAVIGVDLEQLRAGPAWPLVRGWLAGAAVLGQRCPDELDHARHLTVALTRGERTGITHYAIVRGVERARVTACLAGAPAAPLAMAHASGPCGELDAAIHELDRCGDVPLSQRDALAAAHAQLAQSAPGDPLAACSAALAVVERARTRRDELGWECRAEPTRPTWLPAPTTDELDARSALLDQTDLVYFVDDHTLAIVAGEPYHVPDRAQLQDALASWLAHPRKPHWSDAIRARLPPHDTAWLALQPREWGTSGGTESEPSLVTASVDARDHVHAEVRFSDAPVDDLSIAQFVDRALTDPDFAGLSLTASCADPSSLGPRAARCGTAIEHRAAVRARAPSVGDAVEQDSALARCAQAPWSDAYLACLDSASSSSAIDSCDAQLGSAEHEASLGGPLCGARDVRVEADLSRTHVEALLLAHATKSRARADCRVAGPLATPTRVRLGPIGAPHASTGAGACFGSGDTACWTVDLASSAVARWDEASPDADPMQPCRGPFTLRAPGFEWSSPNAPSCYFSPDVADPLRRTPVSVLVGARAATIQVCRDKACQTLRPSGAVQEIAIDTRGSRAALVTGPPAHQRIETWDLELATRGPSFTAGTTAARPCAQVAVLEDTALAVTTGGCTADTADSGDTRLVTAAGKPIAPAGGPGFEAVASSPIALGASRWGGDAWGFVSRTGDAFAIQNVATGEIVARMSLGAASDPGAVSAAGDGVGHVAIAYGGSGARAGSITSLDVAGDIAQASFALPVCP